MASKFFTCTDRVFADSLRVGDIFQYRGAIRQVESKFAEGMWMPVHATTLSGQGKGKAIKVNGYALVNKQRYSRRLITY